MTGIAVMDIGKSNAKLSLVCSVTGELLETVSSEFSSIDVQPYPQLDTTSIWHWYQREIARIQTKTDVSYLCVTAHGATAALINNTELTMPVLDYEFQGPEECNDQYDELCDSFSKTLSPKLPGGLNLGRQLFWQRTRFPESFAKAEKLVPYTQFWTWKLTGIAISEVTTLGSHTDLWFPIESRYSTFATAQRFAELFAPLRKADEVIGSPTPEFCSQTGVKPSCRVIAGIHDSNASLIPYLKNRSNPFTVMSTGTWVIILAVGAKLQSLDPARGCTANVNIFSEPVATSRFMGGREFAQIAGEGATGCSFEDLCTVLESGVFALPSFAHAGGPFSNSQGSYQFDYPEIKSETSLSPAERYALATVYCALVSDVSLDLSGSLGDVIVEGAFSRNDLLLQCLAVYRPNQQVLGSLDSTGTTMGTAMLVTNSIQQSQLQKAAPLAPALQSSLIAYRARWCQLVGSKI